VYFDGTFKQNWRELAEQQSQLKNVYKGAYHFMASSDEPNAQAQNFLSVMGKLALNDLPPTLDLEWDFQRKNGNPLLGRDGNPVDGWAEFSADQIVARVMTWLRVVEQATRRRPVIYTNFNWWSQRIASPALFRDYKIWIADYASKSLGAESPKLPTGYDWVIWKFTDAGSIPKTALPGFVDANEFKGSESGFVKLFWYHTKVIAALDAALAAFAKWTYYFKSKPKLIANAASISPFPFTKDGGMDVGAGNFFSRTDCAFDPTVVAVVIAPSILIKSFSTVTLFREIPCGSTLIKKFFPFSCTGKVAVFHASASSSLSRLQFNCSLRASVTAMRMASAANGILDASTAFASVNSTTGSLNSTIGHQAGPMFIAKSIVTLPFAIMSKAPNCPAHRKGALISIGNWARLEGVTRTLPRFPTPA
jgi:GH25 family lysozyme M1 (1,4-beta-N-acetylmuramidase)